VAYWVSLESPNGVLAFIKAHAPEGARESSSGYGGTEGRNEFWFAHFDVPTKTPLAGPRALSIEIALAPQGHYAVRLDAVVAWHRRRQADSLVPGNAKWLKATVTQRTSLFTARAKRRTLQTVLVSDPPVVHAVAQAVNALPFAEPAGPAPSCPAVTEPRAFVHLTFRASALSAALAKVLVENNGCSRGGEASVWIRVRDHQEVALTDHLGGLVVALEGTSLIDRIEQPLGHRLHLR
jgi:hypothetical protein